MVASRGFAYRPERPQAEGFAAQKWAWTGTQPGGHGGQAWSQTNAAAAGKFCVPLAFWRDHSVKAPACLCLLPLAAGDWVELEFDSRAASGARSGDGGRSSSGATAYLVHLKSFEGMGTAAIECASGCTCSRRILDGTWANPASLQQIRKFTVSAPTATVPAWLPAALPTGLPMHARNAAQHCAVRNGGGGGEHQHLLAADCVPRPLVLGVTSWAARAVPPWGKMCPTTATSSLPTTHRCPCMRDAACASPSAACPAQCRRRGTRLRLWACWYRTTLSE